jgi:hypothetical protein
LRFGQGVSKELQKVLLDDLKFVESIKLSGQTKRNEFIYGGASGTAYANWFLERIGGIGYAGIPPGSISIAIAFVQTSNPHVMWLTSNFLQFPPPQAWRIGVLWHEARHSETENRGWNHISCPPGMKDRKGEILRSLLSGKLIGSFPGCDTKSLGAYGSASTLSGNIAKYCTNCSEKVKADAALFYGDGINRQVTEQQRDEVREDLGEL